MNITPEAVRTARQIGVYGHTAKRLARMVRRSARITCASGNRRFGEFILDVNDDVVRGVTRVSFTR